MASAHADYLTGAYACSFGLQLASADISKHPIFKDCVALLRDVANYVKESGKRTQNLQSWQEICDSDLIKLEQLSQVIHVVL